MVTGHQSATGIRQTNIGSSISQEMATELKTLIFGSANRIFPPGWVGQAFAFNKPGSGASDKLKFGLYQEKGGPCGILAAVQAYIIRFLTFICYLYLIGQHLFSD